MRQGLAPGFYPFWFWNGKITADEIRWQIGQMAAQGIKGFYIHPRQGLELPYLSEGFMEMVEVAVQEAERHGLTVHLYDEYPYPSGVAGGGVILGQPQYLATRLIQRSYDLPPGPVRLALPVGKVLSCVAFPLDGDRVDWERGIDLLGAVGPVLSEESYVETGLTAYNRKRYFASEPVPVLQTTLTGGPHRLIVSVQGLVEGHKYWGGFVDVLNPEAVQEFLRLTHERYYARFSAQFGKLILSIFLDETEPGWSQRIPDEFLKEYGYDLIPLLPALADRSHPEHPRVAKDLHRLRYRLFLQAFEGPISRWCREHGILYAAEKPSLRFSQLKYSDLPGCEPGHTKAGAKMDLFRPALRSNARAAASAAYFYGKPAALCECYHSLGWSGTLQDAKLIAEGLLLMGVTFLVPHGFFYTTHGLKKHDAPPSFFFQMPYWPLFGHLSQRIDAIARRFEGTFIDAEILVVDPAAGLPGKDEQEAYERLLDLLMSARVDFLIGDTDVLEAGVIVKASGGNDGEPQGDGEPDAKGPAAGARRAHLKVRDLSVKLVLVPPMPVMEEGLARWLRRFEAAGGRVLRVDAAFDAHEVKQEILRIVRPHLPLEVASGDEKWLYAVTRKNDDRRLWFLLNTGREPIEVVIRTGEPLAEVVLDEGTPSMLERIQGGYRRTIAPFESVMIEKVDGAQPGSARGETPGVVPIRVRGSMRVEAKHPNLLRLYRWEMALLGPGGEKLESAPVRAMPLANQLAESGMRIRPHVRQSFGQVPRLSLSRMDLRYTTTFDLAYDGTVKLVIEPGSLVGDWRIVLNGDHVVEPPDFEPVDAHVRGSLGVDITPSLKPGRNEIAVELSTDRHDGGLVNPLYLAGEFGVKLGPAPHPPAVIAPVERGRFDAWEENGMPYYAGVVEYTGEFAVTQKELETRGDPEQLVAQLDFGVPFDDACEVSINGGAWQPVLWSPRRLLIQPGDLRAGLNHIAVRVYTTLIRAFEGQRFDIPSHSYQEVETVNTTR